MVKRYISMLALFFAVGCSMPKQAPAPAPVPPAAPSPVVDSASPAAPPRVDVRSLQRGAWVDGPAAGPSYLDYDLPSPDTNWVADVTGEQFGTHALWIFDRDRTRAMLLEPSYFHTGNGQFTWTDRNTLIYYRELGPEEGDTWFEADPATGKNTPFLPELLSGNHAGQFRFSPDKKRMLFGTGYCSGCNKPSANDITTYLVELATGTATELGVDVLAAWDGDHVKAVAQAPTMGYSGPAFWDTQQRGGLPRPLSDGIQVYASDYVELRAYRRDAAPGDKPFKVIPAYNTVDTYNTWELWWPDPPAEPFRLEAWAEVRATVPEAPPAHPLGYPDADIRWEDGKRWAVVFSREITMLPDPPQQTVLLKSAHMWDPQNGWGVGFGGRILRTVDGGATWRDVTPAGFDRCSGRYRPRQTETFAGPTATVAIACDRTGPNGKWTAASGRVTVFRSVDGGAAWQTADIDTEYRFASAVKVEFLSAVDGYAVIQPVADRFVRPEPGAVYRTSDGGRTWRKATDTAAGLPSAREVKFLDLYRGWAVGTLGASLWSTTDGGITWQPVSQNAPVGGVSAPAFISGAEGYYVNGRELCWTTDGGLTWPKRSDLPKGWGRPAFLTPSVGYLWEYESRTVYWTHDGGRTWEPTPWDNNPTGIDRVQFLDEQHGFAVQGLLWKTEDGGGSWTETFPQIGP